MTRPPKNRTPARAQFVTDELVTVPSTAPVPITSNELADLMSKAVITTWQPGHVFTSDDIRRLIADQVQHRDVHPMAWGRAMRIISGQKLCRRIGATISTRSERCGGLLSMWELSPIPWQRNAPDCKSDGNQ